MPRGRHGAGHERRPPLSQRHVDGDTSPVGQQPCGRCLTTNHELSVTRSRPRSARLPGAFERRRRSYIHRAARNGDAPCTTSPRARATSSPTASSATTASPAPPTTTWTSTPAATSSARSSSRSTSPEVARAELSRPSWKREHVALGTNTDPYQWVESRYKLMPGIWEALLDSDTPCSLVTKSPLALRDIDILQRAGRRAGRDGLLLGTHAGREGLARDRAAHPLPPRAARRRCAR